MFTIILLQANSTPSFGITNFLFFGLIIAVFYFFMVRPQQKKQKKQKLFLQNLKKGDIVVSSGGLHGKIVDFENEIIILEIAKGVRIKISKAYISLENSETEVK